MTGVVFAASFVLAGAAFSQTEALVAFGGLFQRITVTVGFGWLTALAIHLLKGGIPNLPTPPPITRPSKIYCPFPAYSARPQDHPWH